MSTKATTTTTTTRDRGDHYGPMEWAQLCTLRTNTALHSAAALPDWLMDVVCQAMRKQIWPTDNNVKSYRL